MIITLFICIHATYQDNTRTTTYNRVTTENGVTFLLYGYHQIFRFNLYTCNTTIQFLICIFIRNIRKISVQSIESINKPSIDAMIDYSRLNLVREINIKRTISRAAG